MEPIDYLRSLRRRWRVILSCLLLAVMAALLTAPSAPEQAETSSAAYTATATMLQEPGQDRSVQYLALFVTSGDVPIEAARRLNFSGDPRVLASEVIVTPDTTTGALTIAVTGTDGQRAAMVANVFAESLVSSLARKQQDRAANQIAAVNDQLKTARQQENEIQNKLEDKPGDAILQAQRTAISAQYGALYAQLQALYAQQSADPGITLLERALPVPIAAGGFSAPSSRWGRVWLGALAGLVLGCILALVLERFDTRLRTRAATQDSYRLPILAEIPRLARTARHGHAIIARTMPGGAAAEAYRALRSSLQLLPSRPVPMAGPLEPTVEDPLADEFWSPKVVLVVSAREGEGKTSTVVNVAATMAEGGKRVLVLDCDLRAPEAHLYLDVPNGSGMSELLESPEDQDLLSLSRPTAVPGVRLVTGGRGADHSSALPTRLAQIITEARDLADIVLIDTTPMLVANDAIDLMPTVDSVLVVARAGRTTREQAERTVELLGRMRVPVSGVALIGTGQADSPFWLALGPASNRSGGARNRSTRQRPASKQGAR